MFFRIPRLTPGYIRYLQTQAAQTVVQSREGPATPRMAFLLGLVGIGMSGYSSRQLTLHYKPSNHLFR
ncbi:diacylglycerol diphosphate phosphatase / phosphatidate phosphatase [Sarotherodon galilaeus]